MAGLRAMGVGARLTRGLGVGIALEVSEPAQAEALVDALRAQIEETLDRPTLALSAAGPALRRIETEVDGHDVIITVELSASQLDSLLDLVEELLEPEPTPTREAGIRLAPRVLGGERADPEPDEVIRAGGPE